MARQRLWLVMLTLALTFVISACTALPQQTGLPQYTRLPLIERPSVNFGVRRPNFVILHYTSSDNPARALNTLTDPLSKVLMRSTPVKGTDRTCKLPPLPTGEGHVEGRVFVRVVVVK